MDYNISTFPTPLLLLLITRNPLSYCRPSSSSLILSFCSFSCASARLCSWCIEISYLKQNKTTYLKSGGSGTYFFFLLKVFIDSPLISVEDSLSLAGKDTKSQYLWVEIKTEIEGKDVAHLDWSSPRIWAKCSSTTLHTARNRKKK